MAKEQPGNGSLRAPYRTRDGKERTKVGFTLSTQFVVRFKAFQGTLPLGTTASEWVEKTLDEAMEREGRKKKAG